MNYHYICESCRTVKTLSVPVVEADTDPTKRLYDNRHMTHGDCGGTFKRQWGFRQSKYHHVDLATGKEFTSEREFAAHLRAKSNVITDRTGIVHDLQPIDLLDPAVRPDGDDGLRTQHDAWVKAGKVESKGKFVHEVKVEKPASTPKPPPPAPTT